MQALFSGPRVSQTAPHGMTHSTWGRAYTAADSGMFSNRPLGVREVRAAGAVLRATQQSEARPGPSTKHVDAEPSTRHAGKEPIQWTKQWYPAAALDSLNSKKPTAVEIIGRLLVLWQDASGTWRAFEDRCPHRAAPLSEGRIDPATQTLQCSYHGWRFEGDGTCSQIPQAPSSQNGASLATQNPRTCAASYPVCVDTDLVWVWMESGPQAWIDSAAKSPAVFPNKGDPDTSFSKTWFVRELPVSFEYLQENLMDAAHVIWAHHGILGSRDNAVPLTYSVVGDINEEHGVDLRGGESNPSSTPHILRFTPPGFIWFAGKGPGLCLGFYTVPVRPGVTRLFSGSTFSAAPASPDLWKAALTVRATDSLAWITHLANHEVYDGDTYFIHKLEMAVRTRAAADGADWRSQYVLPTSSDKPIVLLRRWLDDHGGEGPYPPGVRDTPIVELSREQVMDRWNQHTKDCPHCTKALRNVQRARAAMSVAAGAALAAGLGAALIATSGALPAASGIGRLEADIAAALVASAGLAAVTAGLSALERRFIYVDYVHHNK